jgi:predicted lipoprotein
VKQLVGCDGVFGSELLRQINDALFCPRGTREIAQALSRLHPHIFSACENPSGVAMLDQSPERVMAYFQDQRVRFAAWYFTRPEP